jgi:hypothetical protein
MTSPRNQHKDRRIEMSGGDKSVNNHHHYYGAAANGPGDAAQGSGAQPYGQQGYGAPGAQGFAPQAFFNPHPHPTADSLVKGVLVGAAAAYLLSNQTAQRVILRTAVQAWAAVRGGVEELKERFHDVEAEVAAETVADAPKTTEAAGPAIPAAEI